MRGRIREYVNYFVQFEDRRRSLIESIKGTLERIDLESKKQTEDYKGFKLEVLDLSDNTITFIFLDFKFYIVLNICSSKQIGYIEWFLINTGYDKKPVQVSIQRDSYDYYGAIKTPVKHPIGLNVGDASYYFIHTLIDCCEKIDQMELNKKDK